MSSHNTHALRDGRAAGVSYAPAPGYADMDFDPVARCWITRPEPMPHRAPAPAVRAPVPRDLGPGARWAVLDRRSGCALWRFTAPSFDLALGEKRRLCLEAGWRSGDAYLREEPRT